MTEQVEVSEERPAIRQMPGSLLRQAREAQGLSLGEVAGALKFTTRQIDALENDNHEFLQGKTFLRGFIRAYARMLKLPPEALLDMLEVEPIELGEQIVPPENMGETNPIPFYRRYSRLVLMVIAVAIIVAGLAWFYGDKSFYSDRFSSTDKSTSAVQPTVVTPPAVQNAIQAPPAAQNAIQAVDLSAVSTAPTMSATVAQAVSPSGVSFEFRDLSWLEVKDSSGQVLLTGEFPAGQKQTASGKPPYQLWIGKASAVQVTYNGQPVDLQPYTHDEVARLTLDK